VEEKRLVVQQSEEKFQAQVFKMTTDDDMPSYNGFDFAN
jgi:ribosomal protein L18